MRLLLTVLALCVLTVSSLSAEDGEAVAGDKPRRRWQGERRERFARLQDEIKRLTDVVSEKADALQKRLERREEQSREASAAAKARSVDLHTQLDEVTAHAKAAAEAQLAAEKLAGTHAKEATAALDGFTGRLEKHVE